MKIKLKKGKQKELFILAKKNKTWRELATKLKVNEQYLCRDLKLEKRLLSKEIYDTLCFLTKENFDNFIIERLENNWGQIKGGENSLGNSKNFKAPRKNKKLAEAFGIILGDGHVSEFKKGKKARVYCVSIAGNTKTDKDYIFNYIPNLFLEVFKENGSTREIMGRNIGYFSIYGKNLIKFLKEKGLGVGNKLKNKQGIPLWIKQKNSFLKACLRGLIDTDGSIHKISKNNKNLRIDFTSYIPALLKDTREAFIKIGFNPSKIISNKHFFISKQKEILKYVNEIGFSNSKNLKRFETLKNWT